MTEQTLKPVAINQPLRLNLQCSLVVESESEAIDLYEEIGTFVKGVKPSAIISGNILKMLSPCCGDKTHDPRFINTAKKT